MLITADSGGSNGPRNRLWKLMLQKFADETGTILEVCHFPPGTSKWNKIEHNFWRPVVAIRNADDTGNPATIGNPNWTPLGAQASNPQPGDINFTPPFPAYTSGHAAFGAATFKTLERFYGRDDISFTFISDEFNGITRDPDGQARPIRARTFHSFSQAALENGQSRIYLGIHWGFDRDEGIKSGNAIAGYIFDNFLQPVP